MDWIVLLFLLSTTLGFGVGYRLHRAAAQWALPILPLASAIFLGLVFSALFYSMEVGGWSVLPYFFLGGLATAALHRYSLLQNTCCSHVIEEKKFNLLSVFAISVCSLNDGGLMGLARPELWSPLALSMFAHKMLVALLLIQVVLLSPSSRKIRLSVLLVFLSVSPMGYWIALSAGPFLGALQENLLALSAGVLCYLGVYDAIHKAAHFRKKPAYALKWGAVALFTFLVTGAHFLNHH